MAVEVVARDVVQVRVVGAGRGQRVHGREGARVQVPDGLCVRGAEAAEDHGLAGSGWRCFT